MEHKEAVVLCQKKVTDGETVENLVPFLKQQGFQIIPSIKVIREVLNTDLGKAKRIVAGHNAWKNIATQMDAVHKEIIDDLNKSWK